MGDPWGIGGFWRGGKPKIKQIVKNMCQIISKIDKIGKKWEKSDFLFLLKMVWNTLGTPRNFFKSQKSARKPVKSPKSGKIWANCEKKSAKKIQKSIVT